MLNDLLRNMLDQRKGLFETFENPSTEPKVRQTWADFGWHCGLTGFPARFYSTCVPIMVRENASGKIQTITAMTDKLAILATGKSLKIAEALVGDKPMYTLLDGDQNELKFDLVESRPGSVNPKEVKVGDKLVHLDSGIPCIVVKIENKTYSSGQEGPGTAKASNVIVVRDEDTKQTKRYRPEDFEDTFGRNSNSKVESRSGSVNPKEVKVGDKLVHLDSGIPCTIVKIENKTYSSGQEGPGTAKASNVIVVRDEETKQTKRYRPEDFEDTFGRNSNSKVEGKIPSKPSEADEVETTKALKEDKAALLDIFGDEKAVQNFLSAVKNEDRAAQKALYASAIHEPSSYVTDEMMDSFVKSHAVSAMESKALKEQDEEEEEDLAGEEMPGEAPAEEPGEEMPGEEMPAEEMPGEPEAPVLVKCILGRTDETIYYIVPVKNEEDEITDIQVDDQEGTKKYLASENELALDEVGRFICQAVKDLKIQDISSDVFMKYVYPMLVEEEEEEQPEEQEETPQTEEPEQNGDEGSQNSDSTDIEPRAHESKLHETKWFDHAVKELKADQKFQVLLKSDMAKARQYISDNFAPTTKKEVEALMNAVKVTAGEDGMSLESKKHFVVKVVNEATDAFALTIGGVKFTPAVDLVKLFVNEGKVNILKLAKALVEDAMENDKPVYDKMRAGDECSTCSCGKKECAGSCGKGMKEETDDEVVVPGDVFVDNRSGEQNTVVKIERSGPEPMVILKPAEGGGATKKCPALEFTSLYTRYAKDQERVQDSVEDAEIDEDEGFDASNVNKPREEINVGEGKDVGTGGAKHNVDPGMYQVVFSDGHKVEIQSESTVAAMRKAVKAYSKAIPQSVKKLGETKVKEGEGAPVAYRFLKLDIQDGYTTTEPLDQEAYEALRSENAEAVTALESVGWFADDYEEGVVAYAKDENGPLMKRAKKEAKKIWLRQEEDMYEGRQSRKVKEALEAEVTPDSVTVENDKCIVTVTDDRLTFHSKEVAVAAIAPVVPLVQTVPASEEPETFELELPTEMPKEEAPEEEQPEEEETPEEEEEEEKKRPFESKLAESYSNSNIAADLKAGVPEIAIVAWIMKRYKDIGLEQAQGIVKAVQAGKSTDWSHRKEKSADESKTKVDLQFRSKKNNKKSKKAKRGTNVRKGKDVKEGVAPNGTQVRITKKQSPMFDKVGTIRGGDGEIYQVQFEDKTVGRFNSFELELTSEEEGFDSSAVPKPKRDNKKSKPEVKK